MFKNIAIFKKGKGKIIGDKIFCCLGVLGTAKLVLDMHKSDQDIPMLTTPGGAFILFSRNNTFKNGLKILSNKSFRGKSNDHEFNGNIFPLSENLVCAYFGEFLGSILNLLFRKFIFSRLFIANLYFDSDMSLSKINYDREGIKITAERTPALKQFSKKVVKVIKKEFLSHGLKIIPFSFKLMTPGQDIHYGGSVPMKNNPKNNQCNLNGELKGFKNFYISDASSMPYLASKGQSFNSMVNSYYIASKSIKPTDKPE